MLTYQSNLILKDNSKISSVRLINLYKKKYIKINNSFLGVVKSSKRSTLKVGKLNSFLTTSTKKKSGLFSGRFKKSDLNSCIALKEKLFLEPIGSRFIGIFFSEIKSNKNQKLKVLLNQCI